ncbi:MAG: hypothetical protein AB7N76_07195 [Planctomycetota bacterium]
MQRHERAQQGLGILERGLSPEQAAEVLDRQRARWRLQGWKVAGITLGLALLSVATIGVLTPLFLIWLTYLLGTPLRQHLVEERQLPALAQGRGPD